MKLTRIHFFALVILVHAFVWAQQPSNASSPALAYENGSIANNVYTNECFGFSLPIPDGWLLNVQLVVEGGKARHMPGGELALLVLDQHKEGAFGNRIALAAHDANGSVLSVKDFVSNNAHRQVNSDREHREILKDAYPVDYGGKHFFRADYKHSLPNGGALYESFVYTIFRGYYIGETLVAASPEELEQAANSLQSISFQEDEPNPKCVMKGDDSSNSGVILGVISSKSNTSQTTSGLPQRVRISQDVLERLADQKSHGAISSTCATSPDSRTGHSGCCDRQRRACPGHHAHRWPSDARPGSH